MAEEKIKRIAVPNGDKVYTVRPRYNFTQRDTTDKRRGSPASIQFHMAEKMTSDSYYDLIGQGTTLGTAFEQAISDSGFINFQATNVAFDITEKSQVMHTFGGGTAVYFYGKAPVTVNLSGILMDDLDNDQFVKMLTLYKEFLSGTSASKEFAWVELKLPNGNFQGSFVNISIQQSSDRDTDISFSAQFLATEFTLASTDGLFESIKSGEIAQDIVRDPDPTLSMKTIQEIQSAYSTAALYKYESIDGNPTSTLSVTNVIKAFADLPSLKDLIGFSASDIAQFFDNVDYLLSYITKTVQALANAVSGWVGEVLAMVEAIEEGLDQLISNIKSATNAVFGAIDDIKNLITTICNFPDSLASKLGHFGSPGAASPQISGGNGSSPATAMQVLSQTSAVGAARGTDIGDQAKLAVSSTKNETASLSARGPGGAALSLRGSASLAAGGSAGGSGSAALPPSLSELAAANPAFAVAAPVHSPIPKIPTLRIGG